MNAPIVNSLGILNGKITRTGTIAEGQDVTYDFEIGRKTGIESSARLTFNNLGGQADLDLYLFKGDTQINQSTTAKAIEHIQLKELDAGKYSLLVKNVKGGTQDFSLAIAAPDSNIVPDNVGNSFANATQLDVAQTRFNGSIGVANETDYYSFNMASQGLASHYLNVQYDGSIGAVNLALFDSNQQSVNLSDRLVNVKVAGEPSKLVGNALINLERLAAGNYFVTVNGATPVNYKLTVDVPQAKSDAWTVMTYITADDLEKFAPINIEQMEVVLDNSPNSVNFSVLWDQSSAEKNAKGELVTRYPSPNNDAWGTTGQAMIRAGKIDNKYFLGTTDAAPQNAPRIVSPFTLKPEQNAGDTKNLIDFVTSSKNNAPAQNYALVMWNHGGGTGGLNFDKRDNHPDDPNDSSKNQLTTSKMVQSLEKLKTDGINLSLLAFDECYMASTEVFYELRNYAPVLVGSEEVINGPGYDYSKAFQALNTNPENVDSATLAQSIVTAFNDVYGKQKANTLTAVTTSKMQPLIDAIAQFVTASKTATDNEWTLIGDARNKSRQFTDGEDRDLGKFMAGIQLETAISQGIRNAAANVIAKLNDAVFAQTTLSKPTTTGLTIYLPNTKAKFDEAVAQADPQEGAKSGYLFEHQNFITATKWNEFLETFLTKTKPATTNNKSDFAATASRSRTALDFGNVESPLAPYDPISDLELYNLRGGGFNVLAADRFYDAIAFEQTNEPDLFPFAIAATGTQDDAIELFSSSSTGTFRLKLVDVNDQAIREVSSKGNAKLSLQGLAAGSYTLKLETDQDVSNYNIYLKSPGFNPNQRAFFGNGQFQFDGSVKKAAKIDEGVFYAGGYLVAPNQAFYSEQDWYNFQLPRSTDPNDDPNNPSKGKVTIYLAQENRVAKVDLYDDKGILLATNQGTGKISVPFANYDGVDYYFKVSRLAGDTTPLGYSFIASSFNESPSELLISDAPNSGKSILEFGNNPEATGLAISLVKKPSQTLPATIDEIGLLFVDDSEGSINGLKPGQSGYVQAAMQRGKTIFSVLPDAFAPNPTRLVDGFATSDRFLSFYLIKNSTRDAVTNNPSGLQSQVIFGKNNGTDTGAIVASSLIGGSLAVDFRDPTNKSLAITSISVSLSDDFRPIGSALQDDRELIDLSQLTGKTVAVSFPVVASEAAFNNTVGFYRIENATGTVRDPFTGVVINPGESGYALAAVRSSQEFGVSLDRNDSGFTGSLTGGFLYAPYIIVNASVNSVVNADTPASAPDVYFAYLGANSDKADHVRLLGDNTWGFEDLPSLGDADYNDIVIRAILKTT
ncbi:MAG: clostripain-related cysteine peptidase [Pseudanabaena sp. ELA607]